MCVSPVRIRNPNYGLTNVGLGFLKDCTSKYINVPCGHCCECVKTRQMSFVQRVQMECLDAHLFFCTLTYNNDSLPSVVTSTGYSIHYADISDIQRMFKRLRKSVDLDGRYLRYAAVSELGSSRGRPHFHLLFFVEKRVVDSFNDCLNLEKVLFDAVLLEWRRNYGSRRVPDYRPLCTYVRKFVRGKLRTNFDLHYVNPVLTDGMQGNVSFYVSKYIVKPSDRAVKLQRALRLNLDEDEYKSVWSVVRPRLVCSRKFGYHDSPNVRRFIRDCVLKSKSGFDAPKFFNPVDGKPFPLSRYYVTRGEFYNVSDALDFYYKSDSDVIDGFRPDERTGMEKVQSIDSFNHKFSKLDFDFDDFEDLF